MKNFKELRSFLLLWSTQSLSQLGSSMTAFALTLWLFEKTGSALETAMLSICSYAPYVIMSIFAGALSDRWDKKKTMLVCDALAALSTCCILVLVGMGRLLPWHLYVVNGVNGLMNTVQAPASDVALSLLVPREHYQQVSGLKSFSNSLITILHPVLATTVYSLFGIYAVIFIDLATWSVAMVTLLVGVSIPEQVAPANRKEPLLKSAKAGLAFLVENRMLLWLILFLAAVNFVSSAFNATLPAFVLSQPQGGENILGFVSACAGVGTMVGSVIVTLLPKPKNRVRVVCLTMLFSLGTENFILSVTQAPFFWCAAQFIGWCVVPVMGANLDVVLRSSIPVALQGRVYSCRNTLQFFTIPLGLAWGGWMVDKVCNPIMGSANSGSILSTLFGTSGAAMVLFILGIIGVTACLVFGKILSKYTFQEP